MKKLIIVSLFFLLSLDMFCQNAPQNTTLQNASKDDVATQNASQKPAWLSNPNVSNDKNHFFIVGKSLKNTSVLAARNDAVENALLQIMNYLSKDKTATYQYREFKSARIISQYYDTTKDGKNVQYEYSVLVSINNSLQDICQDLKTPIASVKKAENSPENTTLTKTTAPMVQPDWITNIPQDEENIYFTGVGFGINGETALKKASKSASEQVAAYLDAQVEKKEDIHVDDDDLQNVYISTKVKLYAEADIRDITIKEIENYSENKDGRFISYTLVSIPKSQIIEKYNCSV